MYTLSQLTLSVLFFLAIDSVYSCHLQWKIYIYIYVFKIIYNVEKELSFCG